MTALPALYAAMFAPGQPEMAVHAPDRHTAWDYFSQFGEVCAARVAGVGGGEVKTTAWLPEHLFKS